MRYNTRHGAYNRHLLVDRGTFDQWPLPGITLIPLINELRVATPD
jgi:hypothetical protein